MRLLPQEKIIIPSISINVKILKFKPPLFTNLINKCPATMLAANRTDSVIGQMKFLTSSIKIIRGIKAPGLISINIQIVIAIHTLREILLDGVKV